MSLFRAVRSLVGSRDRERDSDDNEAPSSGHRRQGSLPGARGRLPLSTEEQKKLEKLKSSWTVHHNMSDGPERSVQFRKLLSAFVSLYSDKDFAFAVDTFGERNLKQFTFLISRQFVRDVRVAWKVNLPPESNSKSLITMLSSVSNDEQGGFELLCALETVCNNGVNVDMASDMAVPSTLVKIVQLLFSLPPGAERNKEVTIDKVITLLRCLVNYRSAVMELVSSDLLALLFNFISLPCPVHNVPYKEQTLQIIAALVKIHIDKEIVDYLHAKSTLRTQITQLGSNRDGFPARYVVQAWDVMVDLVKRTCRVSSFLIREFQNGGGYRVLAETLDWVERQEHCDAYLPEFLELITSLVYVGTEELEVPASISPYNNPLIASLSTEQTKSPSVRNLLAFQVLQNHFLDSGHMDCRSKILDCILSIYASNYLNYLLLQQLHTLAHFIEAFESLPLKLKDGVLQVLVFVATVINYVPFQELSSLSCLLHTDPSPTTVVLIFQLVTKLVNFDAKYKEILQEAGLLLMLVTMLRQYHSQMTQLGETTPKHLAWREFTSRGSSMSSSSKYPSIATYTVAMDCITLLLNGVPENVSIFRHSGCLPMLFTFLYHRDTRTAALRVLQELFSVSGEEIEEDLDALIEILQVSFHQNWEMKQEILQTFQRCFVANPRARDAFRQSGGFVCLMSLLVGLRPQSESPNESQYDQMAAVINAIFRTLTAAIASHPANRRYLRHHLVEPLRGGLELSGILSSHRAFEVLDTLLSIATENLSTIWDPEKLLIYNPEILQVMFRVFPLTALEVRVTILKRLLQIISLGKRNLEPLCSIGLLSFIHEHFGPTLRDSAHPLQPLLLSFIEELATHRITPMELCLFISSLGQPSTSGALLGSLLRMVEYGVSPPFVELDMQRCGYASLYLPSFGERSWPPANGYTFLCWIYLDTAEVGEQRFDFFTFQSDDQRSLAQGTITSNGLELLTSAKEPSIFVYPFEGRRWYHVGLVHSRSRFQQSEAKFFVNGNLQGTAKAPYPTNSSGSVGAYIGTPPHRQQYADLVWRVGPCYLLEEILVWDQMLLLYCLGPRYCGNFQGKLSSYSHYALNQSRVLSIVRENDPTSPLGVLDISKATVHLSEERLVFSLNACNVKILNNTRRSDLFTGSVLESSREQDEDGPPTGAVILNAVDTPGSFSRAILLGGSLAVAPSGVFTGIYKIGGIAVVLHLIERCESTATLLNGVSFLTVLVKQHFRLAWQMDRIKGYSVLSSLLYSKQPLLDKAILDKIFELAGVVSSGEGEGAVLVNSSAFRHLILFYPLWKWTAVDVQKLYFRRFNQLLVNNSQSAFNVHRLHRLHVLPKLLSILQDEALDSSLLDWAGNLIGNFIAHQMLEEDLEALTNFLIATLDDTTTPKKSIRRRTRAVSCMRRASSAGVRETVPDQSEELPRRVIVRNMILEIIANVMTRDPDTHTLFLKVITPYWVFLFVDRERHPSTVVLGLKILVLLLQQTKNNFATRFAAAEGFSMLEDILPKFANCTSVYYLLLCLLLDKSPADLPADISTLHLTYSDLFATFSGSEFHIACPLALPVLMAILQRSCAGSSPCVPFVYTNSELPESLFYVSTPKTGGRLSHSSSGDVSAMMNDVNTSLHSSLTQTSPNSDPVADKDSHGPGLKLKRWIVSDDDVEIQRAVVTFVKHLFDNCSEFQDVVWNDKKPEFALSIAGALFPFGTLNYPCDTSTDPYKRKEEEKCHLSAKYLFDLLGHFVITANAQPGKTVPFLEMLFDAPVGMSDAQVLLFQSRLVLDYMDYARTAISQQIFLDNKTVANNLSKFVTFIADRICAGLMLPVARKFFDFLILMIERIENLPGSDVTVVFKDPAKAAPATKSKMKAELQSLYRSMNRVTIHLLYAPYGQTRQEFHATMQHVIEAILFHRDVVLKQWNNDTEFIYVLCQLLYNFLLDDNRKLREASMNVWKLLLLTKPAVMNEILISNPNKGDTINLRDSGFDLLLRDESTAFSEFTFWMGDMLHSINAVLAERSGQVWLTYKANETKLKEEQQRQWSARHATVLGKREKRSQSLSGDTREMVNWRTETISTTQEKYARRTKRAFQEDSDRLRLIKVHWAKLREQLHRQRGVWGTLHTELLDKSKLDRSEGPFRMRKKEKPNPHFYKDYPYVQGLSEGQHSVKIPTSRDCKRHYELHGGYTVNYPTQLVRSSSSNVSVTEERNEPNMSPRTPTVLRNSLRDNLDLASISPRLELPLESPRFIDDDQSLSRDSTSDQEDTLLDEDPFLDETDFPSDDDLSGEEPLEDESEEKLRRLLDTNEKISAFYNCERVDGMVKTRVLLLICQHSLYMVDNYEMVDGELVEVDPPPSTPDDAPRTTQSGTPYHASNCWTFDDIRDVFKRRYLLRPVALELFAVNGRNYFIVLEPSDVQDVYRALTARISTHNQALEDISGNPTGSLVSQAVEENNRFGVMRFWRKDSLTQRWTQGLVSNFQYLMHINTLAGRTYNDLTQYPVFPWVIADYESEHLNLDDPEVYRDLSKPMGALSPMRASEFAHRYDTWIPRENDGVPKWHYGSHYSSAGIVLYYLIRQEPFTQQFIRHLQSGRFDVADRLFHSIRETWMSASGATLNMSDVKELIPEFYYFPEFLMNKNQFDLGKKQTGEVLDNVVLPPWAKGSPLEFIRMQRMALESEYVSAHLHEWIDLIFGCKQQGRAAQEALNVFYFLTYEGSVDIDEIDDPIEKDSAIAQINNFGQTPQQIFKKPHPRRQVTTLTTPCMRDILKSPTIVHTLVKEVGKPVSEIQAVGDRLIVNTGRKICLPTRTYTKFVSWGFLDFSIRISDNDKVTQVIENAHDGQVSCLTVTVDGTFLISGGIDSLIVVRKLKKSKSNRSFVFLQSLSGHFSPISHVAVSRSYSVIVSASQDNTILVWDLNRLCLVKSLSLPPSEERISLLVIGNVTGHILAVIGSSVFVWTVNGILLASRDIRAPITAVTMSDSNEWLSCDYITGHTDGTIRVWNIQREAEQQELVQKTIVKAHNCAVTCIHIGSDGRNLYSGDEQGKVFHWNDTNFTESITK